MVEGYKNQAPSGSHDSTVMGPLFLRQNFNSHLKLLKAYGNDDVNDVDDVGDDDYNDGDD